MDIYSSLFDHFFDIVLVVSASGNIVYANQAAIVAYGYSKEELLGRTIFDIRIEDPKSSVNEQLNSALKMGIEFEAFHHRKDKSKFPVRVRSVLLKDRVKGEVISVIRDLSHGASLSSADFNRIISENQKERLYQERAKIALEGCNFSIWELDFKSSRVDFYNHLEGILHYEAGSVGNAMLSWIKLIHTEDLQKMKNAYRLHIETGKDLVAEIRVLGASGSYHWIRIKGKVSQYSAQGKAESIIGTAEDISDRKEIERTLLEKNMALEELTAEAQKANESKSIFLANMSHEIRTPLNAMLSVVHLLSKTDLNETQSKMLQLLNTASVTLKGIVTEVLDIAKAERESVEVQTSPFSIKSMFQTLFAELQLEANAKGLEVGFYFDPSIQWNVIGDAQKVKQILNNLVSNALKYTERGFVSIKAILTSEDERSCVLTFEVKDSGIGIGNQFKDFVFHKFTQENIDKEGKPNGAGLGLAIAKLYANALEGDIFFESEVNRGSSFYFKCPFIKCDPSTQSQESANEKFTLDQGQSTQGLEGVIGRSILCIDDSLINQDVLQMIIEQMGHIYLSAYNSHEAFKQLSSHNIDLILMDIQLPGLDGYAITKAIRENEKTSEIPIIAMTAYSQREDRDKCLSAGMAEYIAKPVDVDRLKEIIHLFITP